MILDERQTLNLKNSVYNSVNGRYVLGGRTEVSAQALEWWNKILMEPDPSDLVYFMEKKYEGRPDILGHVFYNDSALWWVIAQYNNILDPFTELVEGKLLLIPLLDRVNTLLVAPNKKTGGYPSTRNTK